TCILGPCVISTGGNVTRLQWDDLKRTLTFAWELHVYGSAVLFLLAVVAATFGVIGGANMRYPFCEAFTLANILLLLAGLLRFVQFIIDPYGSRNILPRPVLTALYNLPVPLLLWAQATLAVLALREETSPQQLSVTGGLAAVHCTSLMLADLLSKTLSPALPLMLQTLTICWGTPLPRKQCQAAFLFGSLHDCLSWPGVSLFCYWDLGKHTAKRAGKRKPVSRWNRLLDRNWAELLPNNLKGHKQSCANVTQSVIRSQATPATSIMTVHDNAGIIGGGVLYSSSYDYHASPLWTSGVEWQDHECFLSLIEFDLHPPSPVNLHHSIDKALHHAHLLGVGTLFTPSAPSWTQNEGSCGPLCDNVVSPTTPTTNKAYSAVQQTQVSVIEPLASLTPETVRKV
ncbi:hypothetical protein M9458_023945, partial [Cirrhinus mrigala]